MTTIADVSRQLAELTAAVRQLAANQPLVDLQVAADHLGVSTRTLRRMCAAGEVPFRRVGRTLRFSLAMLGPKPRDRAARRATAADPSG